MNLQLPAFLKGTVGAIILGAVVLILLGGGLWYSGVFGSSEPSFDAVVIVPQDIGPNDTSNRILPYGDTLNFSSVDKFNPENRTFPYPQVSPGEVGALLPNLIGR